MTVEMAKKKQVHKKNTSAQQTIKRPPLVRKYRKTILFNEKEMALINNYCSRFGIRCKSAFIREAIISHILKQMNENYPRLF